ncbi:MAG: helix-turn-helix domain-containing protein [Candidatus Brocadiaceae bacterium]|nr:helix-turn-helix domain-containing protein [Candidatus Brocadiaceae bacterium]
MRKTVSRAGKTILQIAAGQIIPDNLSNDRTKKTVLLLKPFLKEKREGLGLSLREASKLSGVSHTHIWDIEDGRSVPSFEIVMKFLSAYGVAIEVFLRETGYLSSRGELEGLGTVRRVPVISSDNFCRSSGNTKIGGKPDNYFFTGHR